jgi:hypothetical protein
MFHAYYYQIGDTKIKISSDIVFPISKSAIFKKFMVLPINSDAQYSFFELKRKSLIANSLDAEETKSLRRTLKFPKRWAFNPVFRSPIVREAIQPCLIEPELSHMSLSWNRMIIRNFSKNEFHFFYYPESKLEIADPLFTARFRNLIGLSFVKHFGFLLHGAGAITKNGAALFLAPDEGGKTTLINKFNMNKILSDDQVVVRLVKNNFYLCSTPFGTMTCGPAKSKLGGIFLIKKSKQFKIMPANPNDILRFIWKESFFRTVVLPKTLRTRVFYLLYQLCRRIPGYYIHAPIDSLDFKAIDAVMAGEK